MAEEDVKEKEAGGAANNPGGMEASRKRVEKGDYIIQVHVIEARELKARDSGDTSDPVCQVNVLGSKKSTKIHYKTLTCVFDERLYFECPGLESEEINQGKVLVEVFDANILTPNVLIGSFEFDLMEIYFKDHHELYKQWVALTDVTDANEGVQGYLRVTIVVLGPNDEQYIHDEAKEAAEAGQGGLLDVMMPPQVEQEPKLLRVHIYRLEKLPIMDVALLGSGGSCDPYVRVQFSGIDNRSTVHTQVMDVAMMETLTIPVMEPVMARQIIVQVKDSDFGPESADDLIGTVVFNYRDLKTKGQDGYPPRWVHLYGAPVSQNMFDTELEDKMNRAVLPGSDYRGSMLIALDIRDDEEPKAEKFPALWNDILEPELASYALQIDVYQAVECKNGVGKYKLQMAIRDWVLETAFTEALHGTCEWYEIFTAEKKNKGIDTININMPDDPTQCPDVIFYLCEERVGRFSYCKFKWKDIINMGFQTPPRWYSFIEDKVSYQYQDDDFPGNVLLGIRAGPARFKPRNVSPLARPFLNMGQEAEQFDPFADLGSPSDSSSDFSYAAARQSIADRTQSMRNTNDAMLQHGSLVLTVVECQFVPPNSGDVFCQVECGSRHFNTSTKRSTNPEWNEPFAFPQMSIHDEIDIRLNAKRLGGLMETTLGTLDRVMIAGIVQEAKQEPGVDFTHQRVYYIGDQGTRIALKFAFKYDRTGKMRRRRRKSMGLKSLYLHSRVEEMGRPYPVNYQMRVYVYQARDLEPRDDNGLSDPYFVVSYCGAKEQTHVINRNLNPQWLTELILNVQVPQPKAYSPRIMCSVWDSDDVGFGLTQGYFDDLIGRFFVTFEECVAMVEDEKPRWFQLYDVHEKAVSGQVYLAIQFSDPNTNPDPVFKINVETHKYYLHILTLGVRSLTSALGVTKPQIVYTTNKGKEVETDPSSVPDAPNANFRVVRKVPLEIPVDYEMAPAMNIVCRDHLFGGMVQRVIGHGSLSLQKFMNAIPDHPKNAWMIKYESQKILNEDEIKQEEESENLVLMRVKAAEKRAERVAIRKCILVSEREMTGAKMTREDEKAWITVEDYERKQITVMDAVEGDLVEKVRLTQRGMNLVKVATERNKRNTHRATFLSPSTAYEEVGSDDEEKLDPNDPVMSVGKFRDIFDDLDFDLPASEQRSETGLSSVPMQGYQNPNDLSEPLLRDDAKTKPNNDALLHSLTAELQQQEDAFAEEARRALEAQDAAREAAMATEEDLKNDKKKSKKSKKKEQKDKLRAWDKEDQEFSYDIAESVPYNPDDDIPPYMKGRPIIHDELEDEMEMEPFESIDLWTGQSGTIGGWNERRTVGTLKGLWRLDAKETNPFGKGLSALIKTKTIVTRLYILDGKNLFPMDSDGTSDPYLIVRLGRVEFSTRDRYIANSLNPKFHESFEFMSKIPGPSKLEIEIWDWDGLGDDLIGTTVIDIEDRWFSKEWRRLEMLPCEERTLHNPRSSASYGKLTCWLEMMTKEEGRDTPLTDISLPPQIGFDLRIIVWKAKSVVIKDTVTELNDMYVSCQCDAGENPESQDTDIHWRARWGRASWNWRMIFPVELPLDKMSALRLSIWDQDIFTANGSIGEISFSLDQLLKTAYRIREGKPKMVLKKGGQKRFWLEMFHPEFDGCQGKVQVSIEMMTREYAEKHAAGIGRSDPNTNPFLPEPEFRFAWSMNPFSLLRQLLGDKICAKLCGIFCCCIILVMLVFTGPNLFVTWLYNHLPSIKLGSF